VLKVWVLEGVVVLLLLVLLALELVLLALVLRVLVLMLPKSGRPEDVITALSFLDGVPFSARVGAGEDLSASRSLSLTGLL
jgi:hypothetical protein